MDPVVAKIAEQFQVVHGLLRDEVRDLSVEELNWKPAPETNSIAVLVVHTLGSEAEVLRVAANVPGERDRPAEFQVTASDAEDLAAERPRGDRPPETGLHWLLTNYGHAREHLGHIQLTRQLYAEVNQAR